MTEKVRKFVDYCETELDLTRKETYCYRSLSVCLLDSIYSLMNRYTVCEEIIARYVDKFMDGDKSKEGDNLTDLIANMDNAGGPVEFAENVLESTKKAGNTGLFRSEVVYNLAKQLMVMGINSIDDFRNYEDELALSAAMQAIKGVGAQASNYLFMLAGSTDRVKKDAHIDQFLNDLFPGQKFSNDECLSLFKETVAELNKKYPEITVRSLDGMVWAKYR